MPLSGNPLPALLPGRALPIDANLLFTQNWTYTASGALSATGPGGPAFQADLGTGRMDGLWVIDLQSLKVSAGNETYALFLLGSNDQAFGNGNVDALAIHDWAAASSGRLLPTICATTPVMPTPGESVRRHVLPFSNYMGGYLLRYLQAYLVVGGTSPSIKLSSWVSKT